MAVTFDVSILMITHGRANDLRKCLSHLLAAIANCPDFSAEVHVGINGPDTMAANIIRDLAPHFLQTPVKSRSFSKALSPAAARNELLTQARGEWIYFVDDDAFVDSEIFRQFLNLKRRLDPAVAAIGGPNLTPHDSNLFQELSGLSLASWFGSGPCSSRYKVLSEGFHCSDEALILCNLFIRRSDLTDSPFPKDFTCCEENWILNGLQDRGRNLFHSPHLIAWHQRREGVSKFGKQLFRYGQGRGQYFRRAPKHTRLAHALPALFLLYIGALGLSMAVGVLVPPFFWVPLVAYAVLSLMASGKILIQRRLNWTLAPKLAGLFLTIHFSYGTGFLAGWLKR